MRHKAINIKAVILAAGYATRLYPLTLNIPKPLLKITNKKAVIDFIADDLEKNTCIDEVVVVTNHKFYRDFAAWASGRRKRLKLTVLDDGTLSNDDRLGAIGDLFFAVTKRKIAGDVIVIGGDNLFDKGFAAFIEFAVAKRPFPSLGLFDIGDRAAATRFGVVAVARDGKVRGFEEKPARPRTTTVATCLYYFPRPTLGLLREYIRDSTTSNDAPGNYIRWLMGRDTVFGFTLRQGHWYDIGHFDSYKEVVARFNK